MKRLVTLALLVCASMAFSQDNSNIHALRVYNPNQPTNFGCNGNPCDINYNGGPVFEKAPTV